MANEFGLKGTESAVAKIKAVSREIATKGVRAAATRAMRIVRDAARNTAKGFDDPETESKIAPAIVTRYDGKASKREGGVVVKVGVMGGARALRGDEDEGHWRHKEFGTSKMPAEPFMRPALANNVQQVTDEFIREIEPQIDKALAKARR